jgi:HAAS domain-containing protein
MSQQEFDNYLALLTRLLRVAPQQREQLAEEFRAHLEDRLAELLAGGMEKGKAVQQAIGEFGDAAVLAAELAQVANRKRRRFIMRVSLASAASLAAVGLLALALWPDGRQLAGPQPAVAQVEGGGAAAAAATAVQPATEAVPDKTAEAHQKIQSALDKDVEFNFLDTPLSEVTDFLSTTYKINVVLAKSTLADAAISEDTPVTSSLSGISLRSALRLVLGELKLAYVIENEVLTITTPEDAEGHLFTRVYDVRELLALETPPGSSRIKTVGGGGGFFAVQDEPATKPDPAAGGEGEPAAPQGGTPSGAGAGDAPAGGEVPADSKRRELSDAEILIRLISSTVDPDSWDEVGGPGTIAEYKGLLAISQTREIHEEVERLLNMLHQAAGLEQRVKVVE